MTGETDRMSTHTSSPPSPPPKQRQTLQEAESIPEQGQALQSQETESTPPLPAGSTLTTDIVVPRNVVFFGETGVGKSAIINMLREEADEEFDMAPVSNAAIGCTLTNTKYPLRLGKDIYNLWDTAGLIEGGVGGVTAAQAEENLVKLLESMPGGVNLLVYCVRGRRYRNVIKENYDLFYKKTCGKAVPIILVITGLENEVTMDDWWVQNKKEFKKRNIRFNGHACITSTRGKPRNAGGHTFDTEYEESLKTLRTAVLNYCLVDGVERPVPLSRFEQLSQSIRMYSQPLILGVPGAYQDNDFAMMNNDRIFSRCGPSTWIGYHSCI